MEEYVNRATKIKNCLLLMGQTLSNTSIYQLLLNELPQSYKSVVTTLSNLNIPLTFDQLSSKLLSKAAKIQQRSTQLEDEQALATSFDTTMRF